MTGADAPAGRQGTAETLFSEAHQAAYFRRQLEAIGPIDVIQGLCPWVLYDFRSQRRANSYQGGFNRKGLIAADKTKRKTAFDIVRDFYRSPLDGRLNEPRTGPAIRSAAGHAR